MGLLDSLLNLIGLGFWLSWRGPGPAAEHRAGTLAGALRPPEGSARRSPWGPIGFLSLLAVRPWIEQQAADALGTLPTWSPGPFTLTFRTDRWVSVAVHGALSMGWTILIFQSMALGVALAARRLKTPDGLSRLCAEIAGPMSRWPALVSLTLPPMAAALAWAALAQPLARMGLLPPTSSPGRLTSQTLAVGLSVWLPARWLVSGVLLLRLVHNHVHLGDSPIWGAIQEVGRLFEWPWNLLHLRLARVDLTPLVAAAAAWGIGEAARTALNHWANSIWP